MHNVRQSNYVRLKSSDIIRGEQMNTITVIGDEERVMPHLKNATWWHFIDANFEFSISHATQSNFLSNGHPTFSSRLTHINAWHKIVVNKQLPSNVGYIWLCYIMLACVISLRQKSRFHLVPSKPNVLPVLYFRWRIRKLNPTLVVQCNVALLNFNNNITSLSSPSICLSAFLALFFPKNQCPQTKSNLHLLAQEEKTL